MRLIWDSEAKNLLNTQSIDYNASPYKLRDNRFVHCVGFKEHNTDNRFMFVGEDVYNGKLKEFILDSATELIGHNTINYDHLLLKMAIGLDYSIGCSKLGIPDTVGGKEIIITDTLVMSKTLNPDRPQHSIDYHGRVLGLEKIDWRAKAIEIGLIEATAPKGAEFAVYHEEMGIYMMRDIDVGEKVLNYLEKEWGTWDWTSAYELEKAVAEIITRQEHRGFKYNKELAIECVKDLDAKMEELRQKVEPLIPPKPLTKGDLADMTPTEKQFKKNGEPTTHILNFAKKHGGEFKEIDGVWQGELFGTLYKLPIAHEPLFTHKPAKLDDTLHIKEWLVTLGWNPTQYKERDLTVDSKKKKLTREKFDIAVEKWVDQTLASPFRNDRLDELDVPRRIDRDRLVGKMQAHDHMKRPLIVYTNPTLTVGMEKDIDPALLEMTAKFPYAKEISNYLTYKHRRNSILGGGVDPDDDEDMQKGWMSVERINEDGRIPTPADTCGAATSRFKHRLVANIPRVTSMYGKEMRAQFGVDEGFYQMGYDFDSLEAKIESHYVFRYDGGPEYGVSLTAQKPNDCHTVLANQISILLGRKFPRGTAKNVKYGCLPTDNTEVLTKSGWKFQHDVKLGDEVMAYSLDGNVLGWTAVLSKQFHKDADVGMLGNKRWNVECTEDHRWVAKTGYSSDKRIEVKYGFDLQTNSSILNSAQFNDGTSSVSAADAAVIAWLLTDGYWKWTGNPPSRQNSHGEANGVTASIGQSDKKFHEDVRLDLTSAGISFKEYNYNGMNEFRINSDDFRALLRRCEIPLNKSKHDIEWTAWITNLSYSAIEAFILASWKADGRTTVDNAIEIRQNSGEIADAIAVAMLLTGRKTTVRGNELCKAIRGSNTQWTGFQTGKYTPTRKTDVFCLTTEYDTFVIRQGGVITITGNCSYNAQVKRVAKTVGCSLEEAQIIFDTFWQQAFPLKQLKEAMQAYWEGKGGKRFLFGIDGRKLPIRSKGNVINTAFQSAGVICAKRAMVIHDRKLKAAGLSIDFFLEDWKQAIKDGREFCQQLIAYHDEAQNEVTKSSVEFKAFKFATPEDEAAAEDACKAFKEAQTDRIWSDIGHTDKMFFVAYNRAGELAAEAVAEAGKYYKLNVDLTAGYIIGTNWATCH